MIKIYLPTFLARIKQAIKEGTLSNGGACRYSDTNEQGQCLGTCIVGAGIRDEEGFAYIAEFRNTTKFDELVKEGLIEVPAKYIKRIQALQSAFDELTYGQKPGSHKSKLRHILRHLEITARKDFPEAYAN